MWSGTVPARNASAISASAPLLKSPVIIACARYACTSACHYDRTISAYHTHTHTHENEQSRTRMGSKMKLYTDLRGNLKIRTHCRRSARRTSNRRPTRQAALLPSVISGVHVCVWLGVVVRIMHIGLGWAWAVFCCCRTRLPTRLCRTKLARPTGRCTYTHTPIQRL